MLTKNFLAILAACGLILPAGTSLSPAVQTAAQPGAQGYQPPAGSAGVLGKVADLVQHATVVDKAQFGRHGATFIGKLPSGELYFEVPTMDVDDDGDASGAPQNWVARPVRSGKIDSVHQDETSYGSRLPKLPGHTDGISPFQTPYIVLPGGKTRPFWFAQQGIETGDGAVVIRGSQVVEAVFADAGPVEKIGEMSMKAHQLFGETIIVPGARPKLGPGGQPMRDTTTGKLITEPALVTRNSASKGPFIVIVFPKTSVGRNFKSVDASLKNVIDQRFQALVK